MTSDSFAPEPAAPTRGLATGAPVGRPRPVTLADVAREAGVSPATASFVLSGRAGRRSAGSAATKEKVREVATRLGYVPNRAAQAMRTGRTNSIVIAMGTIGDPWGNSLTQAVRDRALESSLSTLLLVDERWFEFLSGYTSDCSFITSVDFAPDGIQHVRQLSASGHAIVAFSEHLDPEGFDVVKSSPRMAVEDAYRRLRERNDGVSFLSHRPVGSDATPTFTSRGNVFRQTARAHEDPASAASVHAVTDGSGTSLENCIAWLSGPDRPTAVVCSTGFVALTLQSAALRLGISVPDELEIISIGDIPEEAVYLEPVSYYGVSDVFERIGKVIVDRALDRENSPGTLHDFAWEFFPGATTRD